MATEKKINPIREEILMHMDRKGLDTSCFQYFYDDVMASGSEEVFEEVNRRKLKAVLRSEWDKFKRSGKPTMAAAGQLELVFAGIPCPTNFTFRDDAMPGGFATVLSQYSSVYQFALYVTYHFEKKRELDESHQELESLLELMRDRCNGDMHMSLSALSDDFYAGAA